MKSPIPRGREKWGAAGYLLGRDVFFKYVGGLGSGGMRQAIGAGDVAERRLGLGGTAEVRERALALGIGVVGVFENILRLRQLVLRGVLGVLEHEQRLRIVGQHGRGRLRERGAGANQNENDESGFHRAESSSSCSGFVGGANPQGVEAIAGPNRGGREAGIAAKAYIFGH